MRRLLILGAISIATVTGAGAAVAATAGGGSTSKATVSVKSIAGHGKVLVDAKGHVLYRSDQELGGKVRCTGACLSIWQPVTVSGKPSNAGSIGGKLATVKRPDGHGRQVTYNGRLLYSFKLDKPGKVSGDGVKDAFSSRHFTWRVAHPANVASTPAPTTPNPGYPTP